MLKDKAIRSIYPEVNAIDLSNWNCFNADEEILEINESLVSAKLTELQNAEPLRLLRLERDRKLSETDWWCCSDRTPTQAQLDYRKSLRDIPSTAKPKLDENGNLTGVEWPTKPE